MGKEESERIEMERLEKERKYIQNMKELWNDEDVLGHA